jgi:3-hydroxybutyryl-CoA dehydrogenase
VRIISKMCAHSPQSLPSGAAVVGAGTMGTGIALVLARAGIEVRLTARRAATLDRARARLAADPAGASIHTTTSLETALAGVGLVIETILEDVEPKRAVLAAAERLATPGAILTSNTSSLPLASLAGALEERARFAGWHWFNPPELVRLVEIVRGEETSTPVVETLHDWSVALGKSPVIVQHDLAGFAANRLQYALLREAYALVESGTCTREDIDRVLTEGLAPRWAGVGPFETMDLAGLDVHLAVTRNLFPELSNRTDPPEALLRLTGEGKLGVKNGEGLRGTYDDERIQGLRALRDRLLAAIPGLRES